MIVLKISRVRTCPTLDISADWNKFLKVITPFHFLGLPPGAKGKGKKGTKIGMKPGKLSILRDIDIAPTLLFWLNEK
jgi:hypothetical protein